MFPGLLWPCLKFPELFFIKLILYKSIDSQQIYIVKGLFNINYEMFKSNLLGN